METIAELCWQVKRKRIAAGMTQLEAAEAVGISQTYFKRIENGQYEAVPYERVRTILEALEAGTRNKARERQRKQRSAKIKAAFERQGYTLADVARQLDLHQNTVRTVITGRGVSARIEAWILENTDLSAADIAMAPDDKPASERHRD